MNFEMKLKIGETEFTIKEEATTQKEFFEKASFYSGIPTKGFKGGTNLVITYRKVKDGSKFYSIVDKDTNMEFKYGQSKTDNTLFPKEWASVYGNNEEVAPSPECEPEPVAAPVVPKAETPVARPSFMNKINTTPVAPVVVAPTPAPVVQEAPKTPVTSSNPAVKATLARFNIGKK